MRYYVLRVAGYELQNTQKSTLQLERVARLSAHFSYTRGKREKLTMVVMTTVT